MQYVTWDLSAIQVGEELPGTIYLYIDHRFITLRAIGDSLDRASYDRLFFRKVKQVFIREEDEPKFTAWKLKVMPEESNPIAEEEKAYRSAREDTKRQMLDIFQSAHPNKAVKQTLETSKRLVAEVMKNPYTHRPVTKLQMLPRDAIDHSVNVSVLSIYLGMHLGVGSAHALELIGGGALLHDIGKLKVKIEEMDLMSEVEEKLKKHSELGFEILNEVDGIPDEVKTIVMQHHEFHDGSGYPNRLRGNQIHEWARIVALANLFDEIVAGGKGELAARQKYAISQIDQVLCNKFDPQKLDKSLKVLKLGI